MPDVTTPQQVEDYAVLIRRWYAEAEETLIANVARRVAKGIDSALDHQTWQIQRLTELRYLNSEINAEIHRLKRLSPQVAEAISSAYNNGARAATDELRAANVLGSPLTTAIDTEQPVRTLASLLTGKLESTHLRILRATEDAYRSVVAEASAKAMTGSMTRRQAAQLALNRFADGGITGFIDAKGRNWQLDSYTEMATRSTIHQASIEGHLNQTTAHGHNLVRVSDSPEECELCRPWEMKILCIQPDGKHPTVAEARDAGLWHASCTHRTHVYIEGLSLPHRADKNPEGYKERQRQRAIECNIRKWKRREAAAITDAEKMNAVKHRKAWQAEARKFVDDTGRLRRYDRESVTHAR
jgi:hypothetical protein